MEVIELIKSHVWGLPLIALLVGAGAYLTIRLFFLQVRYFIFGFRIAFGFAPKEEDEPENKSAGDISYFQALATALSATVGTGNIVGVAGAILVGGPGALFWMWVTAVVGMATKYAEAVLAVKYRVETDKGYAGGPMYYIEKGLNQKWLGIVFAVLTLIAAFGIGNMVQINAAAGALKASPLEVPRLGTAIFVAFITGMVIIGGVKRIGKVTGILVPIMALAYLIASGAILYMNAEYIPKAFYLVFSYAFKPLPAIAGGAAGLLVLTIQTGVQRGLFSNEAGMGSAPMAAASAKTDYAVKQGLVSMLGPFIDTIVICTLTGVVIITGLEAAGTDILQNGFAIKEKVLGTEFADGFNNLLQTMRSSADHSIWAAMSSTLAKDAGEFKDILTTLVFQQSFGDTGSMFVAAALFFFSISTIIGWYHYSDRALVYLGAGKHIMSYRMIYVLLVVVGGAVGQVNLIWDMSDIANGMMAFPNLVALLFLSGVVTKETKDFFKRYPHRHDTAVKIYMLLLRFLPKNTVSKILGILAGLHLPRFFMIPILLAFARIYKINVKEAELEIKDYRSLNKFFTRSLKNGSRIIAPGTHVIVSPVDGTLLAHGEITEGILMQTKGIEFSLEELLGTSQYLDRFMGGAYATIYLSPQDYHRIHSPSSGRIIGAYYKPGKLFPVNQMAVNSIKRLFSRNERLITYIDTKFGMVALVKVGATSVGKIRVTYDKDLSTNKWFRFSQEQTYDEPIFVQKGEEVGRFEMGSTVMVLLEKESARLLDFEARQKFQYGQPIGYFLRDDEKGEQITND